MADALAVTELRQSRSFVACGDGVLINVGHVTKVELTQRKAVVTTVDGSTTTLKLDDAAALLSEISPVAEATGESAATDSPGRGRRKKATEKVDTE